MNQRFQFYATFDAHGLAHYIPPNIPLLLPASSWYPDGMHRPPIPPQVTEAAADCGGYVASRIWGDYKYTLEQYVAWLTSWPIAPTWAAMMDYCCEPDLEVVTRERQDRTTANAISAWSQYRAATWTWTPTIQGLEPEDYHRHACELAPLIHEMQIAYTEQGKAETFRVGIGTLCRRTNTMATRRVIEAVRAALPHVETFHLWGIKLSIIRAIDLPALNALPINANFSSDSATWHGKMYKENTIRDQATAAHMSIRRYCITVMLPIYVEKIQQAAATRTMLPPDARQQQLAAIQQAITPYGWTIHLRRRRNREFLYVDLSKNSDRRTLYIGPLNAPLDMLHRRILKRAGELANIVSSTLSATTATDKILSLAQLTLWENNMPYLDVERLFTYHAPTPQQRDLHTEITEATKNLALLIQRPTPECAEQTLAIRDIQSARMWANAAIALAPLHTEKPT